MTVEVLLSTDEVQVLGGPSEIQLSVDFGEPGPRGSNILLQKEIPTHLCHP